MCETIISIVAHVVVAELNKVNSAAAAWMFSKFYRLITVGKSQKNRVGLHPIHRLVEQLSGETCSNVEALNMVN